MRLTVAPADVLHRLLIGSSVWNTFTVLIAWLVHFISFFRSLRTVRKGHLTPDDSDAAATGYYGLFAKNQGSQIQRQCQIIQ